MKNIVGTHRISYLENRTFANMPYKNYEVRKLTDLCKIPAHIYWKYANKPHPFFNNLFWDLGLNKYKLLHFFNAVNIGNQPWITTFEQYIPRGAHRVGMFPGENRYIDFVLKRANHKSCKKLIALSEYAYRSQMSYLKEYGKYEDEIIAKIEILHPPQKRLINDYTEKLIDKDHLTFTIVGADFFRKGGKEVLAVFDRLLNEKKEVKLNIISSLDYGDYASGSTKQDYSDAFSIIHKHKNINHFAGLPNLKVLEILKATDVGLLPTYDETYGFFVLECQAAGCPVITTNGAVMPEINNNSIGWMIEVPLEKDGRSIPRTEKEKKNFSNILEESMYGYILNMLENRSVIIEKGERSLAQIDSRHNYEKYVQKMEVIYNNALN